MTQALVVVVIAIVASICAVTLASDDVGRATAQTRPRSERGGAAYAADHRGGTSEAPPCAGYSSAH